MDKSLKGSRLATCTRAGCNTASRLTSVVLHARARPAQHPSRAFNLKSPARIRPCRPRAEAAAVVACRRGRLSYVPFSRPPIQFRSLVVFHSRSACILKSRTERNNILPPLRPRYVLYPRYILHRPRDAVTAIL